MINIKIFKLNKYLLIIIFLFLTIDLNAQIDLRTAKLYKNDITSQTAYRMQQTGTIIIDVRTKKEFKSSRAKNSINIPLFFDNQGKRVFNKNFVQDIYFAVNKNIQKEIILICRSGSRTKLASNILASQGFTNVYNIQKGFSYDWIKENLPIEE